MVTNQLLIKCLSRLLCITWSKIESTGVVLREQTGWDKGLDSVHSATVCLPVQIFCCGWVPFSMTDDNSKAFHAVHDSTCWLVIKPTELFTLWTSWFLSFWAYLSGPIDPINDSLAIHLQYPGMGSGSAFLVHRGPRCITKRDLSISPLPENKAVGINRILCRYQN